MKDKSTKENNKKFNESIDFRLLFKYFFSKKNLFFIIFFICFSALGGIHQIQKNRNVRYEGNFQLLIEDPIKSVNQPGVSSKGGGGQQAIFSGVVTASDLFTLSSFLRSELILNDLAKKFNMNVGDLAGMISIVRGGPAGNANGVLKVNLQSKDKFLGKKIINELAQTYVNSARVYRERKLAEGLIFINKTKPEFEEELKKLDKKFRYFEEKYVLIQDGTITTGSEFGVTNLVSKIDQIKNKLNFVRNENKEIKSLLNKNLELINSKRIITIINDYKLADKSFISSNSLEPSFDELKLLVKKRIEKNNIYIKYLQNQIDEINYEFLNPEILKRTISELLGEIDLVKNAIQKLTNTSENYKLEMAQNSTPWNIISGPYMSDKPVSKPLLNIVSQFFTISSLFSLTIITILILLENKFVDDKQIEDFSGIKIISKIPKINSDFLKELRNYKFLEVRFKEKYKSIKKLVSFEDSFYEFCMFIKSFKTKNNSNVFLITNTLNSDISSNLSFYTAKFFSSLKEKTLLINANCDNAEINFSTKNNTKKGLSQYLSDEKISIDKIIFNTTINENFDFISSGEATKNERLLILSKKMEDLLKGLRKEYSYIFINSQDLHNTETLAISKFSDKTILLFNKNDITKPQFANLLSKIENKEESITLIVSE
tara:strand:- start:1090 stop:3066 length:1977 start_codon:yes stop_codon:yes gene_type:complete